ncbi:hypothetical protein CO657_35960 (plasmid) [Rhizobium acidisoli]|uniref:Uncharacterized protein n=1 Tax=Rhizobium acidisoli TaxID=1538158 RepID=A0AAE5WVD2_9HYPH|nr:hypothetical protein [Rhizobium acidisoli]KPH05082.1 hypothetical protein AOG23_29575 [Rhizobium acidisoli]QAS83171.1 hypothetical protein CO657_35960 [Rhizobium acidisoli]
MIRVTIFFAIAVCAGPAHADQVPFFAGPDAPDYTAKMIEHDTYNDKGGRQRLVQHHNGLTRVEEKSEENDVVYYGHFFKNLVLSASKEDGEIVRFAVSQVEPSQDHHRIREVRESNDVELVGGEKCRWRELVRRRNDDNPESLWFTCLTDDGIEIATKVLFSSREVMSETRLIELRREPVPDEAVRPPTQLFQASTWLKRLPSYDDYTPNVGDFEARLVGNRSQERLLRHYPWWLRQRDGKDGSIRVTVWNELEEQGLYYSASSGERRFEAVRSMRNPGSFLKSFHDAYGMMDMGKRDLILGEDCAWFDRTPNSADAGLRQCLTSDGIPLLDEHWSGWGVGETFKIVALTRRPVSMDEMQPPRDYLDPAAWGLVVK